MSDERYSSALERFWDRVNARWRGAVGRLRLRDEVARGKLEALPDVLGIALSFVAFAGAGALIGQVVASFWQTERGATVVCMLGGMVAWVACFAVFAVRSVLRGEARETGEEA